MFAASLRKLGAFSQQLVSPLMRNEALSFQNLKSSKLSFNSPVFTLFRQSFHSSSYALAGVKTKQAAAKRLLKTSNGKRDVEPL